MGLLETIKGAFGKSTDLAGDVAGKAQDVGEAAVDVAGDVAEKGADAAGNVAGMAKDAAEKGADVAGDVAGATKDAAGSVVEKGKSLRDGGGDAESGDSP